MLAGWVVVAVDLAARLRNGAASLQQWSGRRFDTELDAAASGGVRVEATAHPVDVLVGAAREAARPRRQPLGDARLLLARVGALVLHVRVEAFLP